MTRLPAAIRRVLVAASLALAGPTLAAVPASPPITGTVVDEEGRPIGGSLVIASIGGTALGWRDGGRGKLHCSAIVAGPDGRFVIPAWTQSAGRSTREMHLMQYGATLTAYHPQYVPARRHVFHAIRRIPVAGIVLPSSGEVTIPMRRFERGDPNAWRWKLRDAASAYECDWDGDIANPQVFWEAVHGEVEEYVRVTADDEAGGPLYMLKRVTKRPVTEYQTVAQPNQPSRLESRTFKVVKPD